MVEDEVDQFSWFKSSKFLDSRGFGYGQSFRLGQFTFGRTSALYC
jgi:hypothetical protein